MKILKIVAFLYLIVMSGYTAYSQSIIGIWQTETKQISEELLDCYVFKYDNSFEYRTNANQGLQRIIALGGTYTYKAGELRLKVQYTKEMAGGFIGRSQITVGNDSWSIEGGTVQKKPVTKQTTQVLSVVFVNPTTILIDENKFYKINP